MNAPRRNQLAPADLPVPPARAFRPIQLQNPAGARIRSTQGEASGAAPETGQSPVGAAPTHSRESRSESRGPIGRMKLAERVDPTSRVVVAPSAGGHETGIPAAGEGTVALPMNSERMARDASVRELAPGTIRTLVIELTPARAAALDVFEITRGMKIADMLVDLMDDLIFEIRGGKA